MLEDLRVHYIYQKRFLFSYNLGKSEMPCTAVLCIPVTTNAYRDVLQALSAVKKGQGCVKGSITGLGCSRGHVLQAWDASGDVYYKPGMQ